jgi:hypothetical protein
VSVLEIVLIYGVVPAGIVAVLALLIFVPGAARAPRYRPGRPWEHDPVWYVPHPESVPSAATAGRPGELAIETRPASVLDGVPTAKGGAHGGW